MGGWRKCQYSRTLSFSSPSSSKSDDLSLIPVQTSVVSNWSLPLFNSWPKVFYLQLLNSKIFFPWSLRPPWTWTASFSLRHPCHFLVLEPCSLLWNLLLLSSLSLEYSLWTKVTFTCSSSFGFQLKCISFRNLLCLLDCALRAPLFFLVLLTYGSCEDAFVFYTPSSQMSPIWESGDLGSGSSSAIQ